MDLRVIKLKDSAVIPTRAHPGDAGLDLYSTEAAHLGPGERWSVGTGIALEIPEGHAGLVLPRSGLAREHGIALVNAPGLIDAGYRGEVRDISHMEERIACDLEYIETWSLASDVRILVLTAVSVPFHRAAY